MKKKLFAFFFAIMAITAVAMATPNNIEANTQTAVKKWTTTAMMAAPVDVTTVMVTTNQDNQQNYNNSQAVYNNENYIGAGFTNATPEANIAVKKSANIWATKDVNAVSICAVPTGFKDAAMVIKKESCPNICNDAAVLKDNIPAVTADGANYDADANIKGKSAADIDGSALKIVSEENNQANHCIMTPSIQLE
jgi:predicted aspartyl protease